MRKKLICIGIISMFLLTSFSVFVVAERQSSSTENGNQRYSSGSSSQSGVKIYAEGCYDGYTLCSVSEITMTAARDFYAILIDMNGEEVRHWSICPRPAKMLPDGSVIGGVGAKFGSGSMEVFNLSQLDWDGNILWSFCDWNDDGNGTSMSRQHHDYQREGNPVGYYAPGQEFIDEGKTLILAHYNTFNKSISNFELVDDVIYEVDWNGNLTGYEWHTTEHFDQMGFDWRAKHGIKYHPGTMRDGDWFHANSMSTLGRNHWYDEGDERFHPENIIIDSRNANIIAIISRETGDIVWRVGPDYSKKTLEGRKLGQIIGQHHAHMIPEGLPGAGNILIFDNGGMAGYGYFGWPNRFRGYSRVIEFNPVTFDIVWEYSHRKGLWPFPRFGELHKFFSSIISSAQRLPNGNTLITEGGIGRIFEVTAEKEIVWEYITPSILCSVYRAYRVPPEWVPGNPAGYEYWEST